MRCFIMIALMLTATAVQSQNKIHQYEYWFDGNYAGRQQQSFAGVAQYFLDTGFSAGSLGAGLHSINIRFKDDSTRYSTTISQFFYTKAAGLSSLSAITAFQYWFDNNIGAATMQTVTPTHTLNFNVALEAAPLSNGLHFLHLRFRDNTNQWSSTCTQFLYKTNVSGIAGFYQVNAYQYWFDGQYSQAQTVAISPTEQIQFSAALPAANLSKGLHILHLRFRDKNNQWSSTESRFVYTTNGAAVINNGISRMQYWFDHHFDSAKISTIPLQQEITITELISANNLTHGLHSLHLRIGDTIGQWATTISQFFFKSDSIAGGNNTITGYRYWFNNDSAGSMVVHNPTPQNVILLNRDIDMGCLTTGNNIIRLQFKDAKGIWSTPLSENILLLPVSSPVFRFTGNGNWSNPANWQNNLVPALDLPGCKEIVIDHAPGGQCLLDIPQYLLKNSKLTVLTGKNLIIPQQLEIK